MSEKKGRNSEPNPKVVEETEKAKIIQTLIEKNEKMQIEMNEKTHKMMEIALDNTQQILQDIDQVKELKSDVKVALVAVEDVQKTVDAVKAIAETMTKQPEVGTGFLQEKELEFQSEVIEINDQMDEEDAELCYLKQMLQRKDEKMEKMMADLKATMAYQKKLAEQFEQFKTTSNVDFESISEILRTIAERSKEKGIKKENKQTTTEQQQLEEDGLKPELKAVLNEGQVKKQTIKLQGEKVEGQLAGGSGQLEELKHPEVVVVETQEVMKQTIQQKVGQKKEEEEPK